VSPGAEYERVRDRLIQALEAWRHPLTGERIVEKAYRREEVYHGECFEEAADIIPKWALQDGCNYGFRLSAQAPAADWIVRVPANPAGPFFPHKFSSHRDEAIFAAMGPDIEPGGTIEGLRIIDLAPTILQWLNVEAPLDMDGAVIDFAVPSKTDAVRGIA
jgi:predicted AlkP superfamily phosphohydrolase/phosphomutase